MREIVGGMMVGVCVCVCVFSFFFFTSSLLSSLCPTGVRLKGTAIETCTSCTRDEWPGLRMGCHDKEAGTRCYADTSFLRACLHIISLPGLAWLVLERKGLLAYTESEKHFKSAVFIRMIVVCVKNISPPFVFDLWVYVTHNHFA